MSVESSHNSGEESMTRTRRFLHVGLLRRILNLLKDNRCLSTCDLQLRLEHSKLHLNVSYGGVSFDKFLEAVRVAKFELFHLPKLNNIFLD